MSESLFSTYWYRVANLKPALRDSAQVSRHFYRKQAWYVIRNGLNGRSHRFNAAAYVLIGQMDGKRTVQKIWEDADKISSDQLPTQDEIIQLLGQLHQADLIQSNIQSSTIELFHQIQGQQNQAWKKKVTNPFSLRFPLWDPDQFLQRWEFIAAPLLTRAAFILWLLIVLSALVLSVQHWPELSGRLSGQLFSPQNLILLWLVYPAVKICHELGHAFAVKKWGGEVHEMGIMLLALTPLPYVDASSSSAFPDKRNRIAVAACGMAVELLLASLALFVWLNVEPGLISALAYNVMLIGGVSTLLFNGNPLLRYDGYYILADLAEIPNLGQRSTSYLGYLLQKYVLGCTDVISPVTAPGEKIWFVVYGPISFAYRILILVGLILMVSSHFFAIGVLIAIWGTITLLIWPATRTLKNFLSGPKAQHKRSRIVVIAGGFTVGMFFLIFVFPMPLWTTTQGVVWLPEQSVIRAGVDFEVAAVRA
jgi:putative peptide zinc metalloprotease protein